MVPNELRANFDTEFTVEGGASEVPAGYQPKFVLGGSSSTEIVGTVSGDDLRFALSTAETAEFATGQYWWQLVAIEELESSSSGSPSRKFIDEGTIWVIGALSGQGIADRRSVARKILDAIDAKMQGKATADQQSYVIQSGSGSRSLSRIPVEELLKMRALYASIVAREDRDNNERPLFKRHTFSFVEP